MKEFSFNLMSALLLLGAVQNTILAVALVGVRRGNKLANRVLAALLLVFSVLLLDGFLFETGSYFKYPHLIGLEWPTSFLYGPLVYFYVRALTSPREFAFRWNYLLHLIPFGMQIILSMPFYLNAADEKVRVLMLPFSNMESHSNFSLQPMVFVRLIQMACYLIAALRLIVAYSEKLKQNFSSIEKINLTWLRDIFVALFCLWCMYAFASAFSPRYGVYRESLYFIRLMIAVVVFMMGIKGLRQPQIFARLEAPGTDENSPTGHARAPEVIASFDEAWTPANNAEKEKYRKSPLSDEQSAAILRQLTHVMETGRSFLEPELTLPELSDRLSVSPNHLSQVINGKLKKSFFDFVNEYRVREAKRLLIAPESGHLSILGIAMEAGFNSKNAFYSAFKKCTGMTPSQFREKRKIAEQVEEPDSPERM